MHIEIHGRRDADAPTLVFSSGLGGAAQGNRLGNSPIRRPFWQPPPAIHTWDARMTHILRKNGSS